MFTALQYDDRKVARRKFRKKLDTFIRKGEELATSTDDLQVLIIIHSKELNQIVDFCNCNASDLIRRYERCKKGDFDVDFDQDEDRPSSISITQLPSESLKRLAATDVRPQNKKPKLSASQLTSTRADTEKSDYRSRSPTNRPCSPSSYHSTCDFGLPQFELLESRAQPITHMPAVPKYNSGFSPHLSSEPAFTFNDFDVFLSKSSSYQSPHSSEKDPLAVKDDEDLFDIL